jgi:hypothetical protein
MLDGSRSGVNNGFPWNPNFGFILFLNIAHCAIIGWSIESVSSRESSQIPSFVLPHVSGKSQCSFLALSHATEDIKMCSWSQKVMFRERFKSINYMRSGPMIVRWSFSYFENVVGPDSKAGTSRCFRVGFLGFITNPFDSSPHNWILMFIMITCNSARNRISPWSATYLTVSLTRAQGTNAVSFIHSKLCNSLSEQSGANIVFIEAKLSAFYIMEVSDNDQHFEVHRPGDDE